MSRLMNLPRTRFVRTPAASAPLASVPPFVSAALGVLPVPDTGTIVPSAVTNAS